MQQPYDLHPDSQGKVRDLYDLGDRLLIVASDRISAFDVVLPDPIPHKGEVLTKLSLFWFDLLGDVVPNHLISADVADLPSEFAPHAAWLRGRFMLVKKADVFPVECIVRGYLAGSGWKEYQEAGTVCGIALPAGLRESDRLEEPLFTPSTKAEIGTHDENISFERMSELVGARAAREHCALRRSRSTRRRATTPPGAASSSPTRSSSSGWSTARSRSLTRCSRLTRAGSGRPMTTSPDAARHRSTSSTCVTGSSRADGTRTAPAPALPAEVIAGTSERYIRAYELITGRTFEPEGQVA